MRGVEVTTEISYIDEMNNLKDGRVSMMLRFPDSSVLAETFSPTNCKDMLVSALGSLESCGGEIKTGKNQVFDVPIRRLHHYNYNLKSEHSQIVSEQCDSCTHDSKSYTIQKKFLHFEEGFKILTKREGDKEFSVDKSVPICIYLSDEFWNPFSSTQMDQSLHDRMEIEDMSRKLEALFFHGRHYNVYTVSRRQPPRKIWASQFFLDADSSLWISDKSIKHLFSLSEIEQGK